MARGSYTRALEMTASDWLERRNWLLRAGGLDRLHEGMSGSTRQLLAFAEKLVQDKEAVLDSLEIMKMWLRDLMVYPFSPEKIINRDLTAAVQAAARQLRPEIVSEKIEAIRFAQKKISANANVKLSLETMMLHLAAI